MRKLIASRIITFLILLLGWNTLALASEDNPKLRPSCSGPFRLCGYIDIESKEVVIERRFEVARAFSEGLAAVRIEGLYGYIDSAGKTVIAPAFENAGPFSGGYAEVRINGASGIIDRTGSLVIPATFDRIFPFSGDSFIAIPLGQDYPSIISPDVNIQALGPLSFPFDASLGVYHRTSGWLTDQNFRFSMFDDPKRGLVWASQPDGDRRDRWGLMKVDGTWQVTPRYGHVQRLSDGRAIVETLPDDTIPPEQRFDAKRRGAVDRDGRLVVPARFFHLSSWHGEYGVAFETKPYSATGQKLDPRKGLVRGNGELLTGRFFDDVERPSDGQLPRVKDGEKWFSVDADGRLIPDQREGEVIARCAGGLTLLLKGDKVEFIGPGGQSSGLFDKLYYKADQCPEVFSARREGRWFFVMPDGKVIGGPDGFENTLFFNGDHTAVRLDGKWGIINRQGEFTFELQSEGIGSSGKDQFRIGSGRDARAIDAFGNRIEEAKEQPSWLGHDLNCSGGLRFFSENDLWGLRNEAGEVVIPAQYRALSCFHNGVTWAANEEEEAWCPLDPNGLRREAMDCRKVYYPISISHHYPEQLDDDPFVSSVLWNRQWLGYLAGSTDDPPIFVGDGVRGRGKKAPLGM